MEAFADVYRTELKRDNDLTVFDQIVSEGYNDHLPGQSPGRENLKKYFSRFRTAFPDLELPIIAMQKTTAIDMIFYCSRPSNF